MQLIIAEKPSVARDLARVLGVRGRGEHAIEGDAWVITWCIGHLLELEEPAAYQEAWARWRLELLPMLPDEFKLRPTKHAVAHLRAVKALLREKRFTAVVNACDAGREGELIFRYVYQWSGARLPVRRLWISSLTDDAIRRGMAQLRPPMDDLADAARSRSEADWLVGMNATRAVTVRNREGGHTALYSIGRVQTPTLAMLVGREREIAAFQPRDYWEVRGDFGFVAQWPARLASQRLANAVVDRATAIGRGVVEAVKKKEVIEPPPLLFDLTTLQRTANKRFGFSAQRTLELAQALYERHKVLTYPRTDSRHLTSDVAKELPQLLAAIRAPYDVFAAVNPVLGRRFVDDAKVHDHHAIIPTGATSMLDRDEARIFDLVMRRFLGAFHGDAVFDATEAWLRVGAAGGTIPKPSDEILDVLPPPPDRFFARGRTRRVAGWQVVAGIEPKKDEVLPALVEGQVLPGTFAHAKKQTQPPPRFTEATLLGAMETAGKQLDDEALRAAMKDTGLGTPATRAAIIETLLARSFIVRDKHDLVPTPTGIGLISALPVPSLASPELTGSWEARLARVARGEERRAAFMQDIERYVTELVAAVKSSTPPPPPANQPPPKEYGKPTRGRGVRKGRARPTATAKRAGARVAPKSVGALTCPRCRQGTLLTGARGWGCSRWKAGCGFVVWFETAGKKLTAGQLRELVTTGKTKKAKFRDAAGREVSSRLVLDPSASGGAARLE